MNIKVSHEVPISMLQESKLFNDFDYALVHLFKTHPHYYQYFYNARHLFGREVLLDNSIFELGVAFEASEFLKWVVKLRPSCYIVPDVLENGHKTMQQFELWNRLVDDFKQNELVTPIRKIGVVQGKSFSELVECYQFMCKNADQLAISFDYSYYQTTGLGRTQLERYATGRQRFIGDLIREGIWDWRKSVHLLGCSLAREFRWYVDNNIYNIRSCDTSNPIIAGMNGDDYDFEFGLNTKSKMKLADNIDAKVDECQMQHIINNVGHFKANLRS